MWPIMSIFISETLYYEPGGIMSYVTGNIGQPASGQCTMATPGHQCYVFTDMND